MTTSASRLSSDTTTTSLTSLSIQKEICFSLAHEIKPSSFGKFQVDIVKRLGLVMTTGCVDWLYPEMDKLSYQLQMIKASSLGISIRTLQLFVSLLMIM